MGDRLGEDDDAAPKVLAGKVDEAVPMVLDTIGMESHSQVRARRGRPSRQEQVAERRRALLSAAGDVFRRDGYLAATVDSIAEAAGLTKGAVYSHFDSKADLFLALLEDRVDQRATDHDDLVRRPDGTGSVRVFLERAISASRRDPEWNLALLEFRLVAARDPELNARYARAHDGAVAALAASLGALYEATSVTPPSSLVVLAAAALALDAGAILEALVADDTAAEGVSEDGIDLVARLLGFPSSTAPTSGR